MPRPALNLNDLTRDEKLALIEEIWDSLEAEGDDLPIPDWHRRELDRRDELDKEGAAGVPWEQVRRDIESPRRV